MSLLSNIFQKPKAIPSVGEIYPVLMKDYDEFMDNANVISYTYDHFNLEEIAPMLGVLSEELKLLDLITLVSKETNTYEQTFDNLCKVFSIILRKKVDFTFGHTGVCFFDNKGFLIDRDNYDEIRSIIMKQNLIFSQKIYKSRLVQEWANKVLEARAKNAIDITIEDMITTIAVVSGKHYWDLENYTYYQIKAEFARIGKDKAYHTNVAYQCAGAEKITIEHYAENTDIFKNPFDDVFKSSENSKLDKALG